MYSSTITLECNHDYFHDYFNEYPVSNIMATFMESLSVIFSVAVPLTSVPTDYCYLVYPDVIIINNQMTFSDIE